MNKQPLAARPSSDGVAGPLAASHLRLGLPPKRDFRVRFPTAWLTSGCRKFIRERRGTYCTPWQARALPYELHPMHMHSRAGSRATGCCDPWRSVSDLGGAAACFQGRGLGFGLPGVCLASRPNRESATAEKGRKAFSRWGEILLQRPALVQMGKLQSCTIPAKFY